MSKIITSDVQVVGTLYTVAGNFDLLDLNPIKAFTAIPDATIFYVVDDNGFAVNITVKGEFVIVPTHLEVRRIADVKYILEEEDEVTVTDTLLVETK